MQQTAGSRQPENASTKDVPQDQQKRLQAYQGTTEAVP
jgi:hypothetical protein